MFADVIFPVFSTPYFMLFGVPWAILLALLTETVIYKLMIRSQQWGEAAGRTFVANFISWIAGGMLSAFLPFGYLGAHSERGLNFTFASWAVLLAFAVAFVLSVGIEGLVWRIFLRGNLEVRVWRATFMANLASYMVLLVIFYLTNHLSFEYVAS